MLCGVWQVSHPSAPFGLICVRIPTHLRRSRHGIFYFRIVVPKALRDAFQGRAEIKCSLHTRELREALLRARRLSLTAYEFFGMAKQMTKRPFDPNDPSTFAGLANDVTQFEMTVEEDIATGKRITRIKTDPNSPASIAAGKEAAIAFAQSPSAFRHPASQSEDKALSEEAEIYASAAPATNGTARSRKSVDPAKLTPKERRRLLSRLWDEYSAQKKEAEWTSRTLSDYKQKFDTFLAWIGDRIIGTVTKEDYSAFKNWLRVEYEAKNPKGGQTKGLDSRSVDKYTTAINGLFIWAQNSGYFPDGISVPTAKQTIMSKKAVTKRAKKRLANRDFRSEELAIAFDSLAYSIENQVPHHFWCPLIALFTGARRAEISQLLLRDIRKEGDIWVIDIKDDDVIKHLKNDSARRTVPIHPTLIDIGLLDYVKEVKAAKLGPELFPGVSANKHGEKGNAVGNAWRRYLIARKLRTEEQDEDEANTLTFHSLRHSAVTCLRKNRVSYDLRCYMVGHEPEGQQPSYGEGVPAKTLAEEVLPWFAFSEIDFSKLRYSPGSLNVKKWSKGRADAIRKRFEADVTLTEK